MGDAADDPKTRLRVAGLRATPARIAVLTHLDQRCSPVSHPELCAALCPRGWDRGTLYRNLADLTQAGLVRKSGLGDHLWRYEVVECEHDATDHPHFLCTRCGDVQCLPSVQIHPPSEGVPRVLATGPFEVRLHGICDACRE